MKDHKSLKRTFRSMNIATHPFRAHIHLAARLAHEWTRKQMFLPASESRRYSRACLLPESSVLRASISLHVSRTNERGNRSAAAYRRKSTVQLSMAIPGVSHSSHVHLAARLECEWTWILTRSNMRMPLPHTWYSDEWEAPCPIS